MKLTLWLMIGLSVLTLPASAVVWNAKDCYDQANTQLDLNQCADREFKQIDAELNRLYKTLMASLSQLRQSQLLAAQLAWLKFRDAHCHFEAEAYAGGSIRPMIYAQCLTALTAQRNEQLRAQIKGPEN